MADTAPPTQVPPPQPEGGAVASEVTAAELDARRRLGAELGGYLDKVERSIDAINLMLGEGLLDLILGPHRLLRLIKYRPDEKAALDLLASFGDAAPVVLNAGDFPAFAAAAFGPGSALKAAMEKRLIGPPPESLGLLKEAELTVPWPQQTSLPQTSPAPSGPVSAEEAAPEREQKKWWRPAGLFSKKHEEERAEREAQKKAEALEYSRLLTLPAAHHYYVDGFMDWVGETLEPSAPVSGKSSGSPQGRGVERLMHQYKSPAYVISLARADYDDVMDVKAKPARDLAIEYHKIAALIERQEIRDFAALLPALVRAKSGTKEHLMRDLLLVDFGVVSFAEMALNKVENRADQLTLFRAALQVEPDFSLTGLSSRRDIFERVLREVTASPDPLDKEALNLALEKLRRHPDETAYDIMGLKKGSPNPLARLLDGFGSGLLAIVGALLGVSPQDRDNARRRREQNDGNRRGDGAVAEGRHTVLLRRQLGDRVFEETFDFAARTCVTQIRDGDRGSVVARGTEAFAAIEDKARLREAFAAYARKGGTLSEAEVFPGAGLREKAPVASNPRYGRHRQAGEPI